MSHDDGQADRPRDAPIPSHVRTVGELVKALRQLKVWAEDRSYATIVKHINGRRARSGRPERISKATVGDCFDTDRRRLNDDLVLEIVETLNPDLGYVDAWRLALRAVRTRAQAATVVEARAELPDDLPDFVGRESAVAAIMALGSGREPRLLAIDGMAGVGKTSLVVHAGRLLMGSGRVDEVLYIDLRGFHADPGQPPADPVAVLDAFLQLVGDTDPRRARDLDSLTNVFRQRVRDRRVLVVLDNAADAEQVQPLLPDAPRCITLVTSRHRLAGFDDGTRLSLDVFTASESAQLLSEAARLDPRSPDSDVAATIAEVLGHLPIALSALVGRIRSSPAWTLSDHLDRMLATTPGQRPDSTHAHDGTISRVQRAFAIRLEDRVARALQLSYDGLDPTTRRTLRMLALCPGDDVGAAAAAAVGGLADGEVQAHLSSLVGANLLRCPRRGRFQMHDLVRAHALRMSGDEDRRVDRANAMTRLLDHYLRWAASAVQARFPRAMSGRSLPAKAHGDKGSFDDPSVAAGWLDTEASNVVAATVHAAGAGWSDHALSLAHVIHGYLYRSGHYTQALLVQHAALDGATQDTDAGMLALSHSHLGVVYDELGQYDDSVDHLAEALELSRRVGDQTVEARALNLRATVRVRLGALDEAAKDYRRAGELFEQLQDTSGVGRTRNNLGIIALMRGVPAEAADHLESALASCDPASEPQLAGEILGNLGAASDMLGSFDEATSYFRRSLEIFTRLGHRAHIGATLDNLGVIDRKCGRLRESLANHADALDIFLEIGQRASQAEALCHRGETLTELGDGPGALESQLEALAVAQQIGDVAVETKVRNALGVTRRLAQDLDSALEEHRRATALAESYGDRLELARGLEGIAEALMRVDDPAGAHANWSRALGLYQEIGLPDDVDRVMRRLGAQGDASTGI